MATNSTFAGGPETPPSRADFNALAANFGQSPRVFSQGDFNYDGTVNLADFNILASRFGTVLATSSTGAASSPFGTSSAGELDDEAGTLDELLG